MWGSSVLKRIICIMSILLSGEAGCIVPWKAIVNHSTTHMLGLLALSDGLRRTSVSNSGRQWINNGVEQHPKLAGVMGTLSGCITTMLTLYCHARNPMPFAPSLKSRALYYGAVPFLSFTVALWNPLTGADDDKNEKLTLHWSDRAHYYYIGGGVLGAGVTWLCLK
jgi:hypothetical protein